MKHTGNTGIFHPEAQRAVLYEDVKEKRVKCFVMTQLSHPSFVRTNQR